MIEEAPEFGCPICYTNTRYELVKASVSGTSAGSPIYRCVECDFHFLDPSVYPLRENKRPSR